MSQAARSLGMTEENETSHHQTTTSEVHEYVAKLKALDRVMATIEFAMDGTVITANDNFLNTMGYDMPEIQGKHHRMFCDPEYAKSLAYRSFWDKLNRGENEAAEYKRLGKGGKEVWIQASYNPIFNAEGKPYKVVKFATDITEQKRKNSENEGKISAINKAQAVIEFNLDGTVISANDNFLKTLGYDIREIQGKHHRMFCDPAYANSHEYRSFWERLNRGDYESGEYRRLGKGGREVWIQASYNPILDTDGRPFKVVKFATDITEQKRLNSEFEGKVNAINKAQAVIEFNLDGNVITANDNFLRTLGYDLREVQGRHHRIFVDQAYANSQEYRSFWEKLNRGDFDTGEYKRVGKGGKIIWIQASYNPIFDASGKVYKVVKYATDITALKQLITSIEEASNSLASAAGEMTATATQMSGTAQKTSKDSGIAAAAAEQLSRGVQSLATSTEEMLASIKEIARSANESAQMSKATLGKSQDTNKTITQLGASSQEIGNVIKVISSIAQQTNLLALNATIEAARAGDAGKGFAVVANEVKELAKQTAKATEEITNKISAIQNDTQGAVVAIGDIASAVEKLNSLSGAIAASVEEQTATTNEVSRIIVESSKGVDNIASTVKQVSAGANDSSAASNQTLGASKSLAELADSLRTMVRKVTDTHA